MRKINNRLKMNLGLSMIAGLSVVTIITKFRRDKIIPKGILISIIFGSVITAILAHPE